MDGRIFPTSRPIFRRETDDWIDRHLAWQIAEKTKIVMDKLGIEFKPSAIAKDDIKYIGETDCNVRYMPYIRSINIKKRNMFAEEYNDSHFAEIGNVVTYKGVEYIYTGEHDGWKEFVERFLLNNKEEKNMVMDIRFIGKTSTQLVDGCTNSTVRIFGELKVAKAGNIVMYDDVLFMFTVIPERRWNRISDKIGDNKVRYDKIPCNWMNIKTVIFNNPATIVFWNDGTKTVVKCGENDAFDPEKGLAMAITKKALGNQGNYFNQIKKWLPEQEEDDGEALTITERLNKIFGDPRIADAKKKLLAAQELICDMTFNGATKAELVRAIRFSKDLIDVSKGANIDITESVAKNGIAELEEKYQRKSE